MQESRFKPVRERHMMQWVGDWRQAELKNCLDWAVEPTPIPAAGLMLDSMPWNGISKFPYAGCEEQLEVLAPVLDMPCGFEDVLATAVNFYALKST